MKEQKCRPMHKWADGHPSSQPIGMISLAHPSRSFTLTLSGRRHVGGSGFWHAALVPLSPRHPAWLIGDPGEGKEVLSPLEARDLQHCL